MGPSTGLTKRCPGGSLLETGRSSSVLICPKKASCVSTRNLAPGSTLSLGSRWAPNSVKVPSSRRIFFALSCSACAPSTRKPGLLKVSCSVTDLLPSSVVMALLRARGEIPAHLVYSGIAMEEDHRGGGGAMEGVVGRILEIPLHHGHPLARKNVRRVQLYTSLQVSLQLGYQHCGPMANSPVREGHHQIVREDTGEHLVAPLAVKLVQGLIEEAGSGFREIPSLIVLQAGRLQEGVCQLGFDPVEAASHRSQ